MTKTIALVTGGMGGLGEAICIRLHDAGHKVVVTHSPGNTKVREWLAAMAASGPRDARVRGRRGGLR